jgi:O-antigen/teichoic acid export membrane protein
LESRLKRNVFLKAMEAVVTIAASFTQLAVITHMYTPVTVGDYQLVLAWLFLVSALSCFGGIVMVSTRELSQGTDSERSSIYSSAFFLQVLVAIPLCAVAAVSFSPLTVGTIALLGALIFQLSQSLLVSKEQISRVVVASIVGQVVATALLSFAAYRGCSVSILVGAWATCNVAQGIVLSFQSRAWQAISLRRVRLDLLKKLAVECLPVLVMVLATHLYVRIDVIMLSYFTNNVVVAQYSAGYLFLDQLMILSNFMMGALFPNFARTSLDGGRDFQILYRGILRLFGKYLLPIALLIALFSKYLLGSIYGADYATAWLSLSILMMAAIFAWINGPSGTIFISLKKQHIYMWATLLSLLVNVVGNLILIPIIGAVGAAISTVLTELAICSFCLYWIYRETGYLPWMRPKAD